MNRFFVTLFGCGVLMIPAWAQFGRGIGDWTTSGADAQRSSWIRTDAKISKDNLAKPGFEFLWKVNFASGGKQAGALTEPVLLDRYIGYRGFRSLGFMGDANGVYAMDTDLARIEWRKQWTADAPRQPGCSDPLLTDISRPTIAEIPAGGGGSMGYGGRGGPARSGVGQTGEGAVTLAATQAPRPQNPGRPRGGPPGGFRPTRAAIVMYALSGDGMLHTMYVSNGEEPDPPLKFLAPGTPSRGLMIVGDIAYTSTPAGCGGTNGVWALDLATKQVSSWTESGIAGSEGAAMGPDGTLYASADTRVVALAPKTLRLKDWYSPKQPFSSSPVVFQYKDKVLLAAATRDGHIDLLDSSSLGGSDHQTALATSAGGGGLHPGALASWQDHAGVRWLLAPSDSAIMAWKVIDSGNTPTLEPGWTSRAMKSPSDPLIVNGVVFALSNASDRATLYALDAVTGKELWNSGNALPAGVRAAGVSVGGGQVYVTAADGAVYTFGFWMER